MGNTMQIPRLVRLTDVFVTLSSHNVHFFLFVLILSAVCQGDGVFISPCTGS